MSGKKKKGTVVPRKQEIWKRKRERERERAWRIIFNFLLLLVSISPIWHQVTGNLLSLPAQKNRDFHGHFHFCLLEKEKERKRDCFFFFFPLDSLAPAPSLLCTRDSTPPFLSQTPIPFFF